MNKACAGKLDRLASPQIFVILTLFILFSALAACTPGTYSVPVTQIIPETQLIPITQVVPVTEVVTVTQATPTVQIIPFSIYITASAHLDWQDTGITLPVDHQVTVSYVSGKWNFNIRGGDKYIVGPDGYADVYRSTLDGLCGQVPLPEANRGALIARLGYGSAFLVGSSSTFKPVRSEVLYFRINDDCMGDDTGEIIMQINVAP